MYTLAIHGGAGVPPRSAMTPQTENSLLTGLRQCLEAGEAVLKKSGSALEAVTQAVCALEDDPLFNAGRGAVFNARGKQEMDAAIMTGHDRNAGAVAGIFGPRNPIRAARAVMERTDHVFLIGENAGRVAKSAGVPIEQSEYFFTQNRWNALQDTLKMRRSGRDTNDPARRHGTVGAVALDVHGNLAAATSTGGMTGKAPGRVGDTPCIGAGTFADNKTCAVSATGHGEAFIRHMAAAEIAARIKYAGEDIQTAADQVVMQDLAYNDGSGGVIVVDRNGLVAMPFNCNGMYRASVRMDETPIIAIYDS